MTQQLIEREAVLQAIKDVTVKLGRMNDVSSDDIPYDMYGEMENRGYRKGLKEAKFEIICLTLKFEKVGQGG